MKKLLIGLVGLVIVLLLVGFVLPSKIDLEHAKTIKAEPAQIYADVANLKSWLVWSAWNSDRDKDCKHTFTGPEIGEGAKWTWKGAPMPDGLGEGEMIVTKADPSTGIEYQLTFVGMKNPMTGAIKFATSEDGTKVTWHSKGDLASDQYFMSLMMKYMNAFGMMKSGMIKELDDSLAKLKERAESRAASSVKPVEATAEKK